MPTLRIGEMTDPHLPMGCAETDAASATHAHAACAGRVETGPMWTPPGVAMGEIPEHALAVDPERQPAVDIFDFACIDPILGKLCHAYPFNNS